MRPLPSLLLIALLVLPFLAGCHQHAAPTGGDKEYDFKGKVVSVQKEQNSIRLDHEAIPGLMKAMEMNFKVEDPKLLEGLSPGDPVEGRLKEKAGEYIILQLRKR